MDMADWHPLGEVHYRKWAVYEEMIWNTLGEKLSIKDYRIYGAPYGGPLTLLRDQDLSQSASAAEGGSERSSKAKEKLLIFTSAGKKLSEVEWENKSRSAGIGWSDQEQMVSPTHIETRLFYPIFS